MITDTETREVVRCRHCRLNQFMTGNGMCRKCRHSLAPESDPTPDAQPVAAIAFVAKTGPNFGFAIRVVRQANDLSQRDLAKLTGMQRTMISRLEQSKQYPSMSSLERFAAAMGTTLYVLVTIAEAVAA